MLTLKNLLIDKEEGKFKIYSNFLGFKLGEWTNFKEINYVAISKVRFARTVSSPKLNGNQNCTSDFTDFKFVVFICKDNRIKHLVFKGEFEDAMEVSNQVAEYLGVEIVDYTKEMES
jgi:hypothetical protein